MPEPDALFRPIAIGGRQIANRMALAPLTRQRSTLDGVPTDLNVEYYRQRASAGLLVSEGTFPSPMGMGYLFTPGLCTDAQVAGWRRVTDAVHEAGGTIFCQLMHVGRLSDPLILPGAATPVAPSAVQPDPKARHYTITCPRPKRPYGMPRALTTAEVADVIGEFRRATENARLAGFDGVELHGASGYLPMQFLTANTNLRTDRYGGGLGGRLAFVLECVDAMSEVAGAGYVAVKIGPGWTFHDVFDDDPVATYSALVRELSPRGLAYLQIGDYGVGWDVLGTLRPLFDGPVMAVAGYTRSRAAEAIAAGRADLVAFGQAYLANPDLVARYRNGWTLNRPVHETYYTQGSEGYTDYPVHADADPATQQPCDAPPTPLSAAQTG